MTSLVNLEHTDTLHAFLLTHLPHKPRTEVFSRWHPTQAVQGWVTINRSRWRDLVVGGRRGRHLGRDMLCWGRAWSTASPSAGGEFSPLERYIIMMYGSKVRLLAILSTVRLPSDCLSIKLSIYTVQNNHAALLIKQ